MPYLVACVAIFTLVSGVPIPGYNILDAIGTVLGVAIAILGTVFIYVQNGGVGGEFFLQRYLAIGFVVGMRCVVAIVAGMFMLLAILDASGRLSDETSVYDFHYMVVAQTLLYWRIGHHVGELANSTRHTLQAQ